MVHNCNAVNDISEIKDNLNDIRKALLGSEYHPGGALGKIRELEDELEKMKNNYERIKYIALGLGIAGGGAVSTVVKLLFV